MDIRKLAAIRGRLRIRARIDGRRECTRSTGFSVCAHCTQARMWFFQKVEGEVIGGQVSFGVKYLVLYVSDSGIQADMDECFVSQVVEVYESTGIFAQVPGEVSGFMPANRMATDFHGLVYPSVQILQLAIDTFGVGHAKCDQYFKFGCTRCGIPRTQEVAATVETSGFHIVCEVTKTESKYYIHTTKTSKANHGSMAGDIDDSSMKTVEIK